MADNIQINVNTDAFHAVLSASPVVQFTLICLVSMSIFSWAIMLQKRSQFETTEQANEPFEERFWKGESLESIAESLGRHLDGDIAIQARIPCPPYFAHAASADRRHHLIRAEFRAWHSMAGERSADAVVSRWLQRRRFHAGRTLANFGQKTVAALGDAFDVARHLRGIAQGAS